MDVDAVIRRLQQHKATNSKLSHPTREQAGRVAWRTIQDWLEAQLELIENGLASLDEVMLPFRLVDADGTTIYRALQVGRIALPPAP